MSHDDVAAGTDQNGATRPNGGGTARRWRVPLILGVGVFAVATNEFVLAGMLPPLGAEFAISVASAGQVVTVFAVACALTGPVLTTLTAARARRQVLLAAIALHLVGVVASAVAPSFPLLLLAQVVAAAGTGLFVPVAAATASAVVAPERRGQAIAIVLTGFTSATAFGAPIGTGIGGAFGWRATLWFVAGLAVLGALGVLALVPRQVEAPTPEGVRERLVALGDRRVLVTLATTMFAFGSAYIFYTYSAETFAPATGGSGTVLAVIILVFGVVSVAGSYVAGVLTDRLGGRAVMAICLVWVAVCLAVLPWARTGLGTAIALAAVLAVTAFSMSAPQQYRLIAINPTVAPVLISLHASVLYLAIALAGVLGGLALAGLGVAALGPIAAVIALLALGLSELAHHFTRTPITGSTAADAVGPTDAARTKKGPAS